MKDVQMERMTGSGRMDMRSVTGGRSRRVLLCGVSALALALGALCAPAAFADASITYSGDVSPAPTSGTTNWTLPDKTNLYIGALTGDGTLTLSGGATLSMPTGSIYVGSTYGIGTPGHTGALILDGVGTTVTADKIVEVGGFAVGTGVLTVQNGATLNTGTLEIGNGNSGQAGLSSGSMLVTGAGTSVNMSGYLHVAGYGNANSYGSLRVENGATVTQTGVPSAAVGFISAGNKTLAPIQGILTVTGDGSLLDIQGGSRFSAGDQATWDPSYGQEMAVITLSDGGHMHLGTTAIQLYTGAVLNIGAAAGETAVAAGTLDADKPIQMGSSKVQSADAPAPTINFNHTDTTTFAPVLADYSAGINASVVNQIAGTTILTGNSTAYYGTVNLTGGTLQLGAGGTTGTINADITNDAVLAFDRSNALNFNKVISGTGSVVQMGTGTLTLSGVNTYSGGTNLNAGTIAVAADTGLGLATGGLSFDGGTLQNTAAFTSGRNLTFGANGGTIKTDKDLTLTGTMSGAGSFTKSGTGELVYTGDGTALTGATAINAGTLVLHGTLGGDVNVATGGTLDGDGKIAGNATIAAGGNLSGTSGQVLDFQKNLTLDANSVTTVAMGSDTDAMFNVSGDLTVNGKLNVKDDGGFGIGVNNVFHADGTVYDNGLTIGTVDPNVEAADLTLNHDDHNVTLSNSGGLTFMYWDGDTTTTHPGVQGGPGTWKAGTANWTGKDGGAHGAWVDANFAIFGGTGGAVTIDNGISAAGMQFTVNGYTMTGGTLTLKNDDKTPIIRVGDGSAGSDAMTATIDSVIAGANGLNKTGKGTLILTGANTYTGDTTISSGTLQLGGSVGHAGSIASTNVINNGTLAFDINSPLDVFKSNISGTGSVVQKGSGVIQLQGTNTFSGGLFIESGTVNSTIADHGFGTGVVTVNGTGVLDLLAHNQTVAGIAGDGTIHTKGQTLTVTQDADAIFAGKFDHTTGTLYALNKQGNGILALTGDNTGNVMVNNGTLQIGNNGTTGSLDGNVMIVTGTQLAFNRTDSYTYAGVISDDGTVHQIGTGTTVLTGENTYGAINVDATVIDRGTLQIGDGGTKGSIKGNVLNNSALAFNRSDAIGFDGAISGSGRVVQMGIGATTFTGANSYTGGLDVQHGIARAGIADVAFGTGLLTVEKDGKADLNGFNTTVAGLSGEGHVDLTGADLTLTSGDQFSGSISGTGGLTLTGGTQVLSGTSDYSGATTLKDGQLQLGSNQALSGASAYTVDDKGTLDMAGFSGTVASLNNSGTITNTGAAGMRLNVAGNYGSNGGTLVINTVLGDDNSTTDQLKVGGDTSGSTKVTVNNINGQGAKTVNGIKVVDIGGQSNGTFTLANGYNVHGVQVINGGAYAYALQKGGTTTPNDGNWYLSNQIDTPVIPVDPTCQQTGTCPPPPPTPTRYSAGVPVYEGYVATMQTLNKLSTLQQRVGDRYVTGKNGNGETNGAIVDERGIWARVEGAHNRLEPDTSTTRMKQDVNTFIMQAGVDGQFYDGEDGKLIAGITGQYGHGRADVSSYSGDGTITTDAWSLGATATWYGNNGFYVDSQAQVTWFDNDLDSWTANTGLANGKKATGYALSLEAGQRIALEGNWSLTPQAQLMWSSIDADAFNDVWGSRVSTDNTDSLTGRLGLAANYRNDWKGDDGLMVNTTVYGIANLYQEMLSGSSVNVAGVKFDTDNDKTWAGVGFGGTYAWADSKYAVYGEGSVNTSLNHFADSYALKGTVGFKVKW